MLASYGIFQLCWAVNRHVKNSCLLVNIKHCVFLMNINSRNVSGTLMTVMIVVALQVNYVRPATKSDRFQRTESP